MRGPRIPGPAPSPSPARGAHASIRRMRHLILLLLTVLPAPAPAQSLSCNLTFELEVTQGIGPYPPGTPLTVAAEFETLRSFRQEGGATAHLTSGTMVLDGDISGRLWSLISTSRDQAANLIGLYAVDVEGLTFVGQEYRGPMTITLYGEAGQWPYARPPITQAEWDSFNLRRSFLLHSIESRDWLAGDITAVVAACVDSAPAPD